MKERAELEVEPPTFLAKTPHMCTESEKPVTIRRTWLQYRKELLEVRLLTYSPCGVLWHKNVGATRISRQKNTVTCHCL